MPCSDGGPSQQQLDQHKIDGLTQMLCLMCRYHLPEGKVFPLKSQEDMAILVQLIEWWKEHQELDSKRKASEERDKAKRKLRQQALNRLTKAEREVLGL